MRYAAGHKEKSRERILEGIGRGFRMRGYGGIGVDGLAKEAGVTSGAFYDHFTSKAAAFRAAVVEGLAGLRGNVEALRAARGADWLPEFIEIYLSEKKRCEPAEVCALVSFSPEVARGDAEARADYQSELMELVAAVAAGLPAGDDAARTDTAWAILSLLAGGVTLARAVPDPALSERIAGAVRAAAGQIVVGENGTAPSPSSQTAVEIETLPK